MSTFRFDPPAASGHTYVLTTGENYHRGLRAEIRAAKRVGERGVWWTVQHGVPLGAWFFIYVTRPVRALSWIGRTLSAAHRPVGGTSSVAWIEAVRLARPLSLPDDLRPDPVLSTWATIAGQGAPRGKSRRVHQREVWDRMVQLAMERNPYVARVVEDWLAGPPQPVTRSLEDYVWLGAVDEPNVPFLSERIMQQRLYEALIQVGFRSPEELNLRAMEHRLDDGTRPDILVLRDEVDARVLYVLELKRFAESIDGPVQASHYAEHLNRRFSPAGWRVVPYVVAQYFSTSATAKADELGVGTGLMHWGSGGVWLTTFTDHHDLDHPRLGGQVLEGGNPDAAHPGTIGRLADEWEHPLLSAPARLEELEDAGDLEAAVEVSERLVAGLRERGRHDEAIDRALDLVDLVRSAGQLDYATAVLESILVDLPRLTATSDPAAVNRHVLLLLGLVELKRKPKRSSDEILSRELKRLDLTAQIRPDGMLNALVELADALHTQRRHEEALAVLDHVYVNTPASDMQMRVNLRCWMADLANEIGDTRRAAIERMEAKRLAAKGGLRW